MKLFIIWLLVFLPSLSKGAILLEYTFDQVDANSDGDVIDTVNGPVGAPASGGDGVDYTPNVFLGVSGTNFGEADQDGIINPAAGSSFTEFFQVPQDVNFNADRAVLYQNGGLATGTAVNFTNAIAANQYISFTASADAAGTFLDLDTLTFNAGASNNRGALQYQVRTSADGFATAVGSGNFVFNGSTPLQTIDLSSAQFDNLSSIEFRIYVDGRRSNGNGGSGTVFDNVILNGELIPEPSSTLLMTMVGVGLVACYRRKRVSA